MKKLVSAICAISLTAAMAGCGSSAASTASVVSTASSTVGSAASVAVEPATLSGKVTTGGSTSMEKVMGALQETFVELYPNVDVTYDPTGSSAGITGAAEGGLDIGLSSRSLHDDETGVTATTIALDGIAIVVNNENAIVDLTVEQIAQIFTGEVSNWSELGGADAEIVVIGREAGSGTRDGFESICGVSDNCVYAQELTATGAVISAVESNAAAIGYASLSAVDESIKALTIGGVACTESTVQDGTYAIQRPFNFVTNSTAAQSEAVKTFLEYAVSADAAELVRAAGAVPLA